MRLHPAVFWRMSLKEWLLAQRGFLETENNKYRQEWERARMIAYFAIKSNPNLKRNSLQKFTDIMRFEWDGEVKSPQASTKEDIDYLLRKAGRFYDSSTNTFHN